MITEIGVGVVLTAAGFGALAALHRRLPAVARMWLSLPVGAAIYLMVALVLVVTAGTLHPGPALAVTGGIGAVASLFAVVGRGWSRRNMTWLGLGLGLTIATVVIARIAHLTRLTPDSLRYLLFAADLREADAIGRIFPADLLRRQMGLPALQALSELTDRRYMVSVGPLFGVFGLGFFGWVLWQASVTLSASRRLMLVLTGVLFLGASNRLLYDVFYINTHIQLAAYLLIAVSGAWMMATTDRWEWAIPAGLALGATLLFRAEAPLVAAIVLVVVAASQIAWRTKLVMTAPSVLVAALWYGMVLWNNAPGGDTVSLTAPVFGSLLSVAGATIVALASDKLPLIARAAGHSDRIMLAGLLILLVVLGLSNPDVLADSAAATFQNLTRDGLWLLTWPVAIVLLGVGLVVHRIPQGRVWTASILGFGLLFWLLPLLRDGAWRVGPGDSGNRILAHILPVVVAFLVLAAVNWKPTVEVKQEESNPAAGLIR